MSLNDLLPQSSRTSRHATLPSSRPSSAQPEDALPDPTAAMATSPDAVYGNICQLSYAPATKTTVVTTTTTTTTSFPPFLLPNPRKLRERDPKQYPLASTPTPSNLKRFSFNVGDHVACFEESSDVDTFLPVISDRSKRDSKNGPFAPSKSSQTRSDTSRFSKLEHWKTKKRSAPDNTPDSLVEGSEFRQSEPLSKKARRNPAGLHRTPVTPHLARSRLHRNTENTLQSPVPSQGAQLLTQARESFELHSSFSAELESPDGGFLSPPSFVEAPAMVATPPVADQDINPMSSFVPRVEEGRPSLDTSPAVTQGNALPSPVLSPVTVTASPALSLIQDSDEEDLNYDNSLIIADENEQAVMGSSLSDDSQSSPLALQDMSNMIDVFDAAPIELQQYFIHQMLRRCPKQTLRYVANIVNPALKCDFLTQLPPELALNVIRYLDAKSLCRAAQVSRRWRELIDSDDRVWKDLVQTDGFVLPKGEVERAVKEGWKWQGLFPEETDLRPRLSRRSVTPLSPPSFDHEPLLIPSSHRGTKRRASFQESSNKRRRIKYRLDDHASGVSSYAMTTSNPSLDLAAMNTSAPELGLRHLRVPHLYKTIYRRHHGFRKSWMDKKTTPHHLAFRAHGRHVVTCLQFDDEKILTGSDDTKINVWNTNTGALIKVLDGHEGGVWALQYDGNTLVSGSTDRTVRVWDVEKGRCLHVFQGHTSTVRCLVILKPTVVGHKADGSPIMMPKEPLIITGSRDSTLRVWKLPPVTDTPFNPTGESLYIDESNPYFVRTLSGHVHSVRAIAAHGDTLISGSYDSTVRVWRISSGEVMHRLNGHTQKVYSVILDHKRNRCISGSMDNLVKVWSLETGQCMFNLEGHSSLVGLLDLNNECLVSAAADWTLRVWDPETGHCKNILTAHTGAITCFQHDGQKVVSGSDRTLKMWNIQTGECVRDLLTDLSGGWQVKFNDRKCVAAVQRNSRTYIEVLDFGAARDGVPKDKLGVRLLVDENGREIEDVSEDDDLDE